jgi:signal transduction histidine kinase
MSPDVPKELGEDKRPVLETPEAPQDWRGRPWGWLLDAPLTQSETMIGRTWWAASAIGFISASFALLIRFPLLPVLNLHLPYLTFFCSSIIAAYLGGAKGGIIATIVGGVYASYFFIVPYHYVEPTSLEHIIGMAIFLLIGLVVSLLFESMHKQRLQGDRLAQNLRETEQKLLVLNRDLELRVEERTIALRQAQERDRANWQRLRSIIAHLSIGVLANDEHGKVLEVNEEYCRLWNNELMPEEVIGRDIWEWSHVFRKHIIDFERHAEALRESSRQKKPLLGELLNFANGRCVLRDFLPIFEAGKYVGEIYLYRDVTQEQRIDAFKSEFMSLASHQLRTPLTGIRWSLGRLLKELSRTVPDHQRHLLESGLSAAKRMSDTINTMLLISQIESGGAVLKLETVQLQKFLQELIDDHQEAIRAKSLAIRLEAPNELIVETDAHLLRELLLNLIGNAVKYTGASGSISVRASNPDAQIRIDVSDNGYGIPLFQQRMIFTKFFRGENVVGHETEGTGLGLYLASLIARHLKGTLTFESSEGGTTFTLILPERLSGDEPHRK